MPLLSLLRQGDPWLGAPFLALRRSVAMVVMKEIDTKGFLLGQSASQHLCGGADISGGHKKSKFKYQNFSCPAYLLFLRLLRNEDSFVVNVRR
jgi:hypothetical protein